jgi:ubiquinone/menaquinone biosynthesis C-methylase UbiE
MEKGSKQTNEKESKRDVDTRLVSNIQYDEIAENYTEKEAVIKKYVLVPSFLNFLGKVKGKKVLDLACGGGYLTRKIREKGARVVGCDISRKMIEVAKKNEMMNKMGIDYFVADASKLGKIDNFDVVTAGFLLHYSPDKETLSKMCRNIYRNLKEDGRFVAINHNPNHPFNYDKKYDVIIEGRTPLAEGDKLTATFINEEGCALFSFEFYFWLRESYEEALSKAGFKEINWHSVEVSKIGIKKFGKEFWSDFLKHPSSSIILEAKK